jgi:hypothetical protein
MVACGGGGGGSSTANYSGTWDVSAIRVINDCGAAVGAVFSTSIVVNQDGERVVVNSGSRVLQGQVNDRDGFTVTDILPPSNGCEAAAAYSFSDASDGEADVGVALLVRCGARECTVGYGGSATRRNGKMLGKSSAEQTDVDQVYKALGDSVLSSGGEEAQGDASESVSELAELSCPAS